MLDQAVLSRALPVGFIGRPLHYFTSLGSTSDEAKELAAQGAPEGTLVVANEQTAGRGRGGNAWVSKAGCSLTFSLILKPTDCAPDSLSALSLLGALAVSSALSEYKLSASIKWPNDVLLDSRKVAGVLVEVGWLGDALEWAVMGIGINANRGSVPVGELFDVPAVAVEDVFGEKLDLNRLLIAVLGEIEHWYSALGSESMGEAWEARLAFLGQEVELCVSGRPHRGILVGLSPRGNVRLSSRSAGIREFPPGAGNLRPVDSQ